MTGASMQIGELAHRTGVNVQTLRYYERRRLVRPPRRAASGFRQYDDGSVQRIRFIRRAQDLGFTLDEIRDLLGMWQQPARACGTVEQRASATLQRIDAKVADLRRMKRALAHYVSTCRNSHAMGECPLLAGLGGDDA